MKIGFIGLGIMGAPMAANLLRAGHTLAVYDLNPGAVAKLAAQGAKPAQSCAALAADSELVVTMLPNSPHVLAAVCGENGVLEGARAELILIDMSSIAPLEAQRVAAACAAKGVRMLEAPVSGGEPKAVEGTLSVMCGGERELFEQCHPVLAAMSSSAVYCGAAGAGNTAKLANQIIVAVNIAAAAEALMLARRAGVDPALVYNAVKGGLAGSAVLDAKAPMMLAGDTRAGFRIDLHIKDLANAIETAHAAGAPVPLAAGVMEMLQVLRAGGHGEADHSALAKYYEMLAGEKL